MSAPTLYRSLRLHRFDPELLAKVVSNVRLEHFLLGDGTCEFVHEHWEQQGVSLDVARYDFRTWVRGEMGNETLSFGLLVDLHAGCWINGAAVDASNLVVFSEGAELACRAGAGAHWAMIQMRRADLQECAVKILGRELCLPKQGMQSHTPRTSQLRVLREVIQSVADSHRSSSGISSPELWRNIAVFALVDALSGVDDRRAEALATKAEVGMQMVRLAEKHVLGNLAESYSSEEFAKALHLTERNLELQFNKIFGMPPHRWRECMGLNIAHRRLKRTRWRPGLVSEVAADCGFQHASRFAALYMRIFGERPNDTGRRDEGVTSNLQCSRRCGRRLSISQKEVGDTELVGH